MKQTTIYQWLFLVLMGFSQNASAQPQLVQTIEQIWMADSSKWRNSGRSTYEYEEDLLVSKLDQYWFTGRNDWGNAEGADYFYNNDGQLEKEVINNYDTGTENYQNLYTNYYYYNENGCLVAEDNEILSIHGQYPNHYYEYAVDENCHVTSRLWKTYEINGDTTLKKNHYVNDEQGHVKVDSQYAYYNGTWQLHYERFFDYDQKGRLIKKDEYLVFSSNNTREYELWTFDEIGELIHRVKVRETNSQPYREISKDSITVLYDSQNRLVQRRTIAYRFGTPDPPKLERFEYYCDDILKQSGLDDLPRIFQTTYQYDVGLDNDCIENLDSKSVFIFPNPATNELTIQSDLLSGQQTKIFIYDALGRQVFEQSFSVLHNTLSIDISNLNQGIYFVTIQNGQKNATNLLRVY